MTKLRPFTELQRNVITYPIFQLTSSEKRAARHMVAAGLLKGKGKGENKVFSLTVLGKKRAKLG